MTELGPMQEKFEAWMENPLDLEKNADGKYLDLETCAYWITWQEAFEAGRSSLESENAAANKKHLEIILSMQGEIDEAESENARLREAIAKFERDRGRHDGEHLFTLTVCAGCDESYVRAEAELSRAVKGVPCRLCPNGVSDGNCGHGVGW